MCDLSPNFWIFGDRSSVEQRRSKQQASNNIYRRDSPKTLNKIGSSTPLANLASSPPQLRPSVEAALQSSVCVEGVWGSPSFITRAHNGNNTGRETQNTSIHQIILVQACKLRLSRVCWSLSLGAYVHTRSSVHTHSSSRVIILIFASGFVSFSRHFFIFFDLFRGKAG